MSGMNTSHWLSGVVRPNLLACNSRMIIEAIRLFDALNELHYRFQDERNCIEFDDNHKILILVTSWKF